MTKLAAVIVTGLLVTACTQHPQAGSTTNPSSSVPVSTGPSAQACPPTATSEPTTRQGTGRGVELWALLFPRQRELLAGDELKIVIRITGPQNTVITATGPTGQTINPIWGPEYHGGSNFDYPGAEFGAGWIFPVAGCWNLHAVNSAGYADLTLRLAPPLSPAPTPSESS